MMGYGGFGMMGLGMLIPLILIALILYAVIKLASVNNKSRDGKYHETNEAINILNEKYAKGEISEEEYKRKKSILRG